MRELDASADPRRRASRSTISSIASALNAGMLAAALGGLDGFVFTAGIGENSPSMRARIAERLAWLGAELDPAANAAGGAADLDGRTAASPSTSCRPTRS